MTHSKQFSVNIRDVFHGFVTAVLTASTTGIVTMLESGSLPSAENIKAQAAIGLAAGFAYLVKKFLTNSDNKLLTKESEK